MRCMPSLLIALLLGFACTPLLAQVVVTIDGDDARADITLAGPGGPFVAEFILEFRDPVNLSPACLGLSATLLDGAGVAAVNARLPEPGLVVDPAFPVLLSVEPPAGCGLSFRGEYRAVLRTPNLVFSAASPYRLYKGPAGLALGNITADVSEGSVRAGGAGGSFSDFVMVRDDLQDYPAELLAAYEQLEARLDDPEIGVAALTTLLNDLAASRAAAAAADYPGAIAALDRLEQRAAAFSDNGVPGRWRALRDLDNIEGDLVSLTGVAKFLLGRIDQED